MYLIKPLRNNNLQGIAVCIKDTTMVVSRDRKKVPK